MKLRMDVSSQFKRRDVMCMARPPIFIMTVDVDSWSSLLNFYSVDYNPQIADTKVSLEKGINNLLKVFSKHQIKATFFTPGEVARRHSKILKKVYENGHEIACHGLTHEKDEFLKTIQEQEINLKKAMEIIERNIGCRPVGFRAPCLRLNEATLKILENNGYLYDSSVVPTFVPGYYGFLFAPKEPYHPSLYDIRKKGSCKLIELPVSVNPLMPLPLSAAWMRNLGLSWVKFGIRMNFIFGYPIVFYVHPRDVDLLPKVNGVPWHLYRNVGFSCCKILDNTISFAKELGYSFVRAVDFVREYRL